ncbi:MAG: helix-turn-helix domain-containing protein [Acidithiobacillus sp.]
MANYSVGDDWRVRINGREHPLPHVHVQFRDGSRVSLAIETGALHDPAIFAQGHADDWGDGLNWPGGLDLGADRLYAVGRKQAGLPTREDFIQWMERNNLSLSHAAEAIGMTRRMMAYYKNGSRQIPKTVWLACIGYEVLERHAA